MQPQWGDNDQTFEEEKPCSQAVWIDLLLNQSSLFIRFSASRTSSVLLILRHGDLPEQNAPLFLHQKTII